MCECRNERRRVESHARLALDLGGEFHAPFEYVPCSHHGRAFIDEEACPENPWQLALMSAKPDLNDARSNRLYGVREVQNAIADKNLQSPWGAKALTKQFAYQRA